MRWFFTLMLLLSHVVAAPALKGKPTLYYATDVGTVFVYEAQTGDNAAMIITDTITHAENHEKGVLITLQRELNKDQKATSKLLVSEHGLSRVTAEALTGGPQPLMKLPAKPNESWVSPAKGLVTKSNMTTRGEEDVQVPAGKFKAIRVDSEIKLGGAGGQMGTTIKQSIWYAPGVGIVKMTSRTNTNPERVQVLTSITKPKK